MLSTTWLGATSSGQGTWENRPNFMGYYIRIRVESVWARGSLFHTERGTRHFPTSGCTPCGKGPDNEPRHLGISGLPGNSDSAGGGGAGGAGSHLGGMVLYRKQVFRRTHCRHGMQRLGGRDIHQPGAAERHPDQLGHRRNGRRYMELHHGFQRKTRQRRRRNRALSEEREAANGPEKQRSRRKKRRSKPWRKNAKRARKSPQERLLAVIERLTSQPDNRQRGPRSRVC